MESRSLPVPDGLDGSRVDAALAKMLGFSRTFAAEVAEAGGVVMDGRELTKSDKLRGGAWLDVSWAPKEEPRVVPVEVPDLGIAYEQMMLFDDAIPEFKVAARDPSKTALCFSMIGVIHEKKGQLPEAVEAYKAGLHAEQLSRDEEMGLRHPGLGDEVSLHGQGLIRRQGGIAEAQSGHGRVAFGVSFDADHLVAVSRHKPLRDILQQLLATGL